MSAAACAGSGVPDPYAVSTRSQPCSSCVRGESDRVLRIEAAARPPVRLGAVVRGAHPEELDRHPPTFPPRRARPHGRSAPRSGSARAGVSLLVLGSVITARE